MQVELHRALSPVLAMSTTEGAISKGASAFGMQPSSDGSDKAVLVGKRVLLVEDEGMIALDVEMMFEDLGIEMVGPACCLADAMLAARTELFDAAMLDVNLRGASSYPVADLLTARGIPFIFATSVEAVDWDAIVPRVEKPYGAARVSSALASLF